MGTLRGCQAFAWSLGKCACPEVYRGVEDGPDPQWVSRGSPYILANTSHIFYRSPTLGLIDNFW